MNTNITVSEALVCSVFSCVTGATYLLNNQAWRIGAVTREAWLAGFFESMVFMLSATRISDSLHRNLDSEIHKINPDFHFKMYFNFALSMVIAKIVSVAATTVFAKNYLMLPQDQVNRLFLWNLFDTALFMYAARDFPSSIPEPLQSSG